MKTKIDSKMKMRLIALLLLMGVSLAVFSGAIVPLLRWQDPGGTWDPRAVALFVAVWMATALTFPVLRRVAVRLVDHTVLRRPDYNVTLSELAQVFDSADAEATKKQIRNAFKKMYDVKVEKVRTLIRPTGDKKAFIVEGVGEPEHESYVFECALRLAGGQFCRRLQ